ncbi:MAG: GMP synthase (glutamine-hydrolyzing) [Thermoproteota archaeon]
MASFIDERYGNLVYVNAADEFIRTMRGIENAEAKRRKFSKMYFRILEDVASRMDAEYISQGTIWPDIVERNGSRFMDAFLLDSRMTGVKGDSRTYDRPLVIETCEKVLPYEAYEHIFLKITSIPMFKVSRVLFATDMRGSDGYVAGFRMVESVHPMTARNMKISKELAEDISEKLSLPNVNFVAYDISNKPSATIEPE